MRRLFELVAAARSADTFVALSLFVAVGMGMVAKALGLTDTAGAFAAGVLLANTNFKFEIQASILPFRGILLGVFFLGAGSNFDPELLLTEGPTIATGVALLVALKASTLWLAGAIDRNDMACVPIRVQRWVEEVLHHFIELINFAVWATTGKDFQ